MDNRKDAWIARDILGRILYSDKGKYAPVVKQWYAEVKSLKIRSIVMKNFRRKGIAFTEPAGMNLEDDYLNAFIQNKAEGRSICQFYKENKTEIKMVNTKILAKVGKRLQGVLRDCFGEQGWDLNDNNSKVFILLLSAINPPLLSMVEVINCLLVKFFLFFIVSSIYAY